MGWNVNLVLITDPGHPFDPTSFEHDSTQAREIATKLGFGDWEPGEPSTLEQAMSPDIGQLFIAAGRGGTIVAELESLDLAFTEEGSEPMERMRTLFPGSAIIVLGLISFNNSFHYTVIDDGKVLRVHAGDADTELSADEGDWLPEEQSIMESSEVRDGERVFLMDGEEWTPDQIGEELVFEVSRRFFGTRLDEIDVWEIPVESFREPRRPSAKEPSRGKAPWWAFWRR